MAMVVGPEGLYFTPADGAGAADVADSGFGVISNELYFAGPELQFAENRVELKLRKTGAYALLPTHRKRRDGWGTRRGTGVLFPTHSAKKTRNGWGTEPCSVRGGV
jgi:hypothetical protein